MVLLLLCVGFLVFQARADLIPLADDAALKPWSRKANTALSRGSDGSLSMEVRVGEFSFGWAQCPLPAGELPERAAGVYGRVRAEPGARARFGLSLILANGKEPIYYTCAQGPLAADGEWTEFYAPLSEFRPERNAREGTLKASMLRPGDRLQLNLSDVAPAPAATAIFDRLRVLGPDEAERVGRAVQRAALARALLPEAACAGAPHPRLLMNPARLARVRAKVDGGGDARAAHDALLKHADGYLRSVDAEHPLEGVLRFEPDADRTPHQQRGQFEGRFTACVIPIEILAAAYRLTGDERYGRHAAGALVSAARALDVDHPALNSGFYYTRTFYVRALAFGYDWLWPLLSPEERRDVKTTLLGFVLRIHADSWTMGWGRRPLHRVWNWDPGLVSCAGLGMLALEGETTAAEKAVLFDLRRHLRDYLTLGIDADGAGHEGPGYLAYGIGAGPEFAECLREQGRGDLFTETNWQLIAPWVAAETLPDRVRWNNLSDCGHGQSVGAVYSYTCGRLAELANSERRIANSEFPSPDPRHSLFATRYSLLAPPDFLQQFAETPGPRRLSYAALASLMGWYWEGGPGRRIASARPQDQLAYLLFYGHGCSPAATGGADRTRSAAASGDGTTAQAGDPSCILPDGLLFRGRGLAVSRTGYGPGDLHFAVEAGPHAAGHDQADKGSFTLYGYGADLAIDSGYGNDGEPLKSGSSHAHNMVLIDGQGQPMHWHNQSGGAISGYRHSPLLDWVRVDAREAWNVRYDGDWRPHPAASPVEKAVRQFLFVRGTNGIPPYLVVMDDIRKDGNPADYTWLWHIPAEMRFHYGSDRWTSVPVSLEGTMLTTAPGRTQGGARFTFKAPADGTYALAGLTRAGGEDRGKSDSFFVGVNGGRRETWHLQSGTAFGWERVACPSNSLTLKKGETVRVELVAREPEAQLAKLALVPISGGVGGAPAMPAPDEQPAGAIVLTADDAELLSPPFLRHSIQPRAGTPTASGRLTVFPVTTDARLVTNRWYETSREGVHPRLEHTIRAVEPRFLMVLVPGTDGTPLPRVRRLAADGGVGAEVAWGTATDRIVFGSGNALKADGLETDGHAAFVRRENGKTTSWALLDGTTLSAYGAALVKPAGKRTAVDSLD
jgi:hypothetical protein